MPPNTNDCHWSLSSPIPAIISFRTPKGPIPEASGPCAPRRTSGQPGPHPLCQCLHLFVPKVASYSLSCVIYLCIAGTKYLTAVTKKEVGLILAHGFRRMSMHGSRGNHHGRKQKGQNLHRFNISALFLAATPCVSKVPQCHQLETKHSCT